MVRDESHVEVTFAAHEMGHGYGFDHSFRGGAPDIEYGDPWDLMSAMSVTTFFGRHGVSGPGLNAPSLMRLGWFPDERAATTGGSVMLAPLNRPDLPGSMAVRIQGVDRVYTVELRSGFGWDTGLSDPAVLIHELRAGYTTGQDGWRWCKNCQSLFYAGGAACPAGGVHALAGSPELVVPANDAGASGQANWRWCQTCQGLIFGGNPPGPCPGGGTHAIDQSWNYTVRLNDTSSESLGDHLWRHCVRCQSLVGRRGGTCAAGGPHEYRDASQYRVEEAGLFGPAGQTGWRWCRKCQSLYYWGGARCAATPLLAASALHDHLGSYHYALALNDPGGVPAAV
jgi:hypothetical protein